MKAHRRPRGGKGQDRHPEQVHRHDRMPFVQLVADEHHGCDQAGREHQRGDRRRPAMHARLQPGDDQPERHNAVDGAHRVVADLAALHVGQAEAAQHQRQDRERHADGEHPRPWRHGENQAARRRRQRGRDGDHDAVEPHAAPELPRRIDGADERRHDAERRRRAQRLHRADDEKEGQRLREEAHRRRDREDDLADLVEPLEADPVAERREREQRHHQHELVHGDHQHRGRVVHLQIVRDGGQRHACDLPVDHRQDRAQRDRRDGEIAARARHPVGGQAAAVLAIGLAGGEVGGERSDHAGVTKLSSTCLVPACSKSISSLLPSMRSILP